MANQCAIELQGISKTFGKIAVNQDISFKVKKGSIHALVGENGAGKSTLMNILFGLVQRDSGKIFVNNQEVLFNNPIEARMAGLGMVHQHFKLAEPYSALDHLLLETRQSDLPAWKRFFFPLPRRQTLQQLQLLSEKFQMPVPWESPIEQLSIGIQQRIEILKLLFHRAEVFILDEPTAVLTPQEINFFFQQLAELKSSGKTILIVTHKLKEVFRIADAVTVLRQGKVVTTTGLQDQTINSLSELMIGRHLSAMPVRPAQRSPVDRVIVRDLYCLVGGKEKLSNLNFAIHPNEILGIAGVEGNGQSELLSAFTRPKIAEGKFTGQIQFQNKNILKLTALQIRQTGVGYFPEDRIQQGVLLQSDLLENFLLGQQSLKKFVRYGFILYKNLQEAVQEVMEKFAVRPANFRLRMHQLSGGNQQKFVVGRELAQNPHLLIAAHPTRGVDIGAIEIIHEQLLQQKTNGSSVLLVSSELDELLKIADRILVLYEGKIAGEFFSAQFDELKIGSLMTGGKA